MTVSNKSFILTGVVLAVVIANASKQDAPYVERG